MFELTIIYKMPNGKLSVYRNHEISLLMVMRLATNTTVDIGAENIISIHIEPMKAVTHAAR